MKKPKKVYISASPYSPYYLCKDGKFRTVVTPETVVYRAIGHARARLRKMRSKLVDQRAAIRPSLAIFY